MKNRKILVKLNLFLIVSALVTGIIYFILPKNELDADLDQLIPHTQTSFVLNSFNMVSSEKLQTLDASYVSVHPQSMGYGWNLFKEKIESKLGITNYDPIFYASKRILELARWEKDLSTLECQKLISIYSNHINSYIRVALSQQDRSLTFNQLWTVKQKLKMHKHRLEIIIGNTFSSKMEQRKMEQLQSSIDLVFESFNQELDKHLPEEQDKAVFFSLYPIRNHYEYGTYELQYSNVPDLNNEIIKLNLLDSNFTITEKRRISLENTQKIEINPNDHILSLEASPTNVLENTKWQQYQCEQLYIYRKKIPPLESNDYNFHFNYTSKPYLVTINRVFKSGTDFTEILYQERIDPKLEILYQKQLQTQDQDSNILVRKNIKIKDTFPIKTDIFMELSSTTPLSDEMLADIDFKIYPSFNPTLILKKSNQFLSPFIDFKIVQNASHYLDVFAHPITWKKSNYLIKGLEPTWKVVGVHLDEQQTLKLSLEYRLHWFLRQLCKNLIIIILVINVLVWLFGHSKKQYKKCLRLLAKLNEIFYDYNLFFLIGNVVLYLLVMFGAKYNNDLIYLMILISGIIVVNIWQLSIVITLTNALILFSLSALFYFINLPNCAEKFSALTIILMLTGSFQTVFSLVFSSNLYNNNWKQLFIIIITNKYILKIILPIKNIEKFLRSNLK